MSAGDIDWQDSARHRDRWFSGLFLLAGLVLGACFLLAR